MSATVVDQLDSLRAHLAAYELPALYSVHVITATDEPTVTMQLTAHQPPRIATGLLAWANTLTDITAQAWRVPRGDVTHLSVIGQLPGGVTIRVYGGLPFTQHGPGANLTSGGSTTMSLAALRHLTTPGEVTL
jgi:FtsP/CotA-like multicopper oxidase with cupredoxin domain